MLELRDPQHFRGIGGASVTIAMQQANSVSENAKRAAGHFDPAFAQRR